MPAQSTLNVSLTPEIKRLVAEKVASGRYRSASEVVRAALRAMDGEGRSDLPATAILEGIGDGFFALDRYWRITAFNSAAERILNRPRSEVLGRVLWDAAPIAGTEYERRYRLVMEEGVAQEFETVSGVRPGRVQEVRAFPLPDGIGVAFRDITERRRNEDALRESAARLRLAVDAGRMAVWHWDVLTQAIETSPELNRLLGFPADHALTVEESRTLYYPGERERIQMAGQEALERGERFFEVEYRSYRLDGSMRWFLLRAEIDLGPDGRPMGVIGVLMDITERKTAEEALREREAELSAALDAAALATFDFDHIAGTMRPSPRLSEIYGYPPDHVLTIADIRARYHPDDREHILSLAPPADPVQRQFEMEFRLLLPDGAVRWINGRGEYLCDDAGRPVRSRGVVADVTERKRWEERQQLLINELNHRVKNTLATVQSIASQTLRGVPAADLARRDIEARLFALARAHDVLTSEKWEGANLHDIVVQTVEPYRGHERIAVEGPDLRLKPQTALALAMALHELATNAVKYGALSNESGRVAVTWSIDRAGPAARLRMVWAESGGPAVVPPARRGFGSRLIERSLAHDLGGEVDLRFALDGVVCRIAAPLDDRGASPAAA